MANTLTLQNSINWSQAYNGYKSLTVGTAAEPAVSSMNIIIQTILAPPFSWSWNRGKITFPAVAGTQDYVVATSTFGFLEKASYQIPSATITNTALTAGVATYTANNSFQTGDSVTVVGTTNGAGIFNITKQLINTATATTFTVLINNGGTNVVSAGDTGTAVISNVNTSEISEANDILGTGSELGPPAKISSQIDDNAGNITFRLLPVPDRTYTIEVIFQKKIPALVTAVGNTWAPIPDHYSYIYQWGFLSLMFSYNGDSRWMSASQKFVAGLLGAAEGLKEEDKNVFQAAWLNTITEQQYRGQEASQGVQSRQV